MPTERFFNAAQEKQERILNAAKQEFSEYSFFDASINRIIKQADISRGGFYLYFNDKEDLFFYIMETEISLPILKKYRQKYGEEPEELFEIGLFFFDTVIELLASDYQAFLVNAFTKMSIQQFEKLLKIKKSGSYVSTVKAPLDFDNMEKLTTKELGKLIKLDSLAYNDEEELRLICSNVHLIVASEICQMLIEKKSATVSRQHLVKNFTLLEKAFVKKATN